MAPIIGTPISRRLAAMTAGSPERAGLPIWHPTASRLIHRAAAGFPDLAADRYADVLVAHLNSAGRRVTPPPPLLKALAEQVGANSVSLKYRPEQANPLSPAQLAALAPPEPL